MVLAYEGGTFRRKPLQRLSFDQHGEFGHLMKGRVLIIHVSRRQPTGQSNEPYWTFNDRHESDTQQIAETDVQGGRIGIGMAGLWSGWWDGAPGVTPKPTGSTIKERAEFYWDKVN